MSNTRHTRVESECRPNSGLDRNRWFTYCWTGSKGSIGPKTNLSGRSGRRSLQGRPDPIGCRVGASCPGARKYLCRGRMTKPLSNGTSGSDVVEGIDRPPAGVPSDDRWVLDHSSLKDREVICGTPGKLEDVDIWLEGTVRILCSLNRRGSHTGDWCLWSHSYRHRSEEFPFGTTMTWRLLSNRFLG